MKRLALVLLLGAGAACGPTESQTTADAAGHSAGTASARSCLRYGPDTMRVTGRLVRRLFYGPPGYGEDTTRDERQPGFYLEFATPVCAEAGADSLIDVPQRNVRLMQLVLDSAGYAQLRPYLGHEVALRGTMFGAHTGHHHAPLLLSVLTPVRVEPKS